MSVTLHTDLGDIKIEVFCEACPKAAENFLALCASDYYNGCLFHRNIKGFMVQTGDPTGTGKGGESIWGAKFPDEIRDELKNAWRHVLCCTAPRLSALEDGWQLGSGATAARGSHCHLHEDGTGRSSSTNTCCFHLLLANT
ncbi:peptidyl-prolyl cis-trans isomerase-like 3 isoform X3 [Dermacentor albipictus]|uniref:peptidyl-prolyl cis-trans isomerase-like 3 isoform X3 n=1 Tax=Dermacentor albipictus TaxID=60249 RepID=UPI0031FC05EC